MKFYMWQKVVHPGAIIPKLAEGHDDREPVETRFIGTQKTAMTAYAIKRNSIPTSFWRQVQKVRTRDASSYPKSQFPLHERN